MPFDPTLPATDSDLESAVMRSQLTGLADLIAADPPGPTGPPGEVTTAALAAALLDTGRNPTSVFPLFLTPATDYDPAQLAEVIAKLNDFITACRREP